MSKITEKNNKNNKNNKNKNKNNKNNKNNKTKKKLNTKNLSNVILNSTNLKTTKETLYYIFEYLKNIKTNLDFKELLNRTNFFGKDKLGASGAKVGILKINNKEFVIKMYKLEDKQKYKLNFEEDCVRFYHPINELIVNSIFSNTDKFLSLKNQNIFKKNFKQYFIPIKSIGIYNNYSYIISNKIGVKDKLNNKYYTNLYEIFVNNYIPNLLECIINNQYEKINRFLKKFCIILKKYFECIKFINEKLGYINTDLKCKNVFVNDKNIKNNNNNNNNKNNQNKTFITDYTPLISDLDKATLKINDLKILTIPENNKDNLLSKSRTRLSKIYEFRYNCGRDLNLCNRFKPYQFDIIVLFYDIYILLYKNIYKKIKRKYNKEKYYEIFDVLNKFVKNTLQINDNEFKKFYDRIHKSYLLNLTDETKLSFQINAMLYYFCKSLDKKK